MILLEAEVVPICVTWFMMQDSIGACCRVCVLTANMDMTGAASLNQQTFNANGLLGLIKYPCHI